jgi:peroxiredoxin
VEIGAPAPDFDLPGSDGHRHRLSDYAGKTVVLEWTSPVCPYTAMKYKSGAMQALQRQAAEQGAVWISIDTAAPGRPGYLTPQAMMDRVAHYHATIAAFLSDPDGKIGRAYGAKTTPSFYIVGRGGRLAYQGAMDDDPSADDARGANYVRAALDDLRQGQAVKKAETHPYGCAVEY